MDPRARHALTPRGSPPEPILRKRGDVQVQLCADVARAGDARGVAEVAEGVHPQVRPTVRGVSRGVRGLERDERRCGRRRAEVGGILALPIELDVVPKTVAQRARFGIGTRTRRTSCEVAGWMRVGRVSGEKIGRDRADPGTLARVARTSASRARVKFELNVFRARRGGKGPSVAETRRAGGGVRGNGDAIRRGDGSPGDCATASAHRRSFNLRQPLSGRSLRAVSVTTRIIWSDVNCDPVSSGGAVEVALCVGRQLPAPNSPIAREGRERRPERAADSARADG